MSLSNQVNNIKTRGDFIVFVQALKKDIKQNPDAWTNTSLANYLEALAIWTADMDGYYINQKRPVPENIPWNVFADILMGA
jgi:hypothetical protein